MINYFKECAAHNAIGNDADLWTSVSSKDNINLAKILQNNLLTLAANEALRWIIFGKS